MDTISGSWIRCRKIIKYVHYFLCEVKSHGKLCPHSMQDTVRYINRAHLFLRDEYEVLHRYFIPRKLSVPSISGSVIRLCSTRHNRLMKSYRLVRFLRHRNLILSFFFSTIPFGYASSVHRFEDIFIFVNSQFHRDRSGTHFHVL